MGGNVKFTLDNKTITGGPIHKKDITDTVEHIAKVLKIEERVLKSGLLGSAGKKDISNDLDIGIDFDFMPHEEFLDQIKNHDLYKINTGLKSINALFPIIGQNSKEIEGYNGFVQVDFFFGNLEWLKFSYFSAGKKSKRSGVERTLLIVAATASLTQFKDYDPEGNLLAKVGEIFDLNKGIITQYRLRRKYKNKTGFVKNFEPVEPSDSEWNTRYNAQNIIGRHITTPNEAAEFIFGKDTKAKDLETAEQVEDIINKLPKERRNLIKKIYELRR